MENGCDDKGERNRFVYKFEMKMLEDVLSQKKDIEKNKKHILLNGVLSFYD